MARFRFLGRTATNEVPLCSISRKQIPRSVNASGAQNGASLGMTIGDFSSSQLESLLFAALGGFLAVFVQILDDALENEQVGAALAGELDAITVIPLD